MQELIYEAIHTHSVQHTEENGLFSGFKYMSFIFFWWLVQCRNFSSNMSVNLPILQLDRRVVPIPSLSSSSYMV